MTNMHSEKFEGNILTAEQYGGDYQIKINGREFGIYTSMALGIKAARSSITENLKSK